MAPERRRSVELLLAGPGPELGGCAAAQLLTERLHLARERWGGGRGGRLVRVWVGWKVLRLGGGGKKRLVVM